MRIGPESTRCRMRRRSPGSTVTRPASASRSRCLVTAWREIGTRLASSVAVEGPCLERSARIARRVGSASAAKTASATASGRSTSPGASSGGMCGVEVRGELAQLAVPALGVAAVGGRVLGRPELREAGLHDVQPGPGGHRLEGELDEGAARGVVAEPVDGPGEGEDPWFLDLLDVEPLI